MNINVSNVTDTKATVCGQEVTREYAENILLPMLVSTAKSNRSAIVKAFDEAGLSIKAAPEAAREYALEKRREAEERARMLAEANAHAERLRVPTAREIAQARADREARAAAIREHGERIRAANRSSGW